MEKKLEPIVPKSDEKCWCCSDLIFADCCARNLPGTKEIGQAYSKYWKEKQFDSVLVAARADVTQYTIWHRSHTERLATIANPELLRMWEIDAEALFDYVERLGEAYIKLERRAEFPAVLERLRANIRTKRWQHKIIHLQAIVALGDNWDEQAASREIAKLGPIESVSDKRILPFYLNLIGSSLGLSERLEHIQRIVTLTDDDTTIMHQLMVKSTLLLTHNDTSGAMKSLREVVRIGSQIENPDTYEKVKLAQAHGLIGELASSVKTNRKLTSQQTEESNTNLLRAVELFSEVSKDEYLTNAGRAGILHELSGVQRWLGNWEVALENERAAIEAESQPIYRVFEAECLLQIGSIGDALSVIDELQIDQFQDDAEKADYVLFFSRLAVSSRQESRLLKAKEMLNLQLVREPLFRQQALEMTKVVLEALDTGGSKELEKKVKNAERSLRSVLNSVFMLKPNLFGIGIDINKAIETTIGSGDE